MDRHSQKRVDGRHRASGNHIETAHDRLRLGTYDMRAIAELEISDGSLKELRAQTPRFDQRGRPRNDAGKDDARQARTRPDVDPRAPCARFEPHQLRRIRNMALPKTIKRRLGDEVLLIRLVR